MSQDHIGRGRGSIQLSRPPALTPNLGHRERSATSRSFRNNEWAGDIISTEDDLFLLAD